MPILKKEIKNYMKKLYKLTYAHKLVLICQQIILFLLIYFFLEVKIDDRFYVTDFVVNLMIDFL